MKVKISHILPIILAIILPGLSFYTKLELETIGQLGFYLGWLVASLLLYLLWHILWYLWKPEAAIKSPIFWILVVLFASILGGMVYSSATDEISPINWPYPLRFLLVSIVFLAIQYALKAQQNITQLLLEKEQIQTENYRVQLKALQAKVDPHFLFNSLNTLRSMVRQGHENAETFIINLSDFFRQTLRNNENSTIPLSEELAVLESFLFLMKNRNEKAIKVTMDISDQDLSKHVPTLALQVIAENCFKHNSMTTKHPLHIKVQSMAGDYLAVTNNVQAKIIPEENSGFGLELLRKRYALMKIENGILIESKPDFFTVQLKLLPQ